MNIKDVNQVADKILKDMQSEDFKKFKLKDKENIIINNPLNLNISDNTNINLNIDSKIEDCIRVVMINGIFKKNLSDKIPEDYYIDSIDNSSQIFLSKIASSYENPVIANNTANFKDGIYIESKGECQKPIYLINYLFNGITSTIVFPRIFIQCNKNSSLKIIEHTMSANNSELTASAVSGVASVTSTSTSVFLSIMCYI